MAISRGKSPARSGPNPVRIFFMRMNLIKITTPLMNPTRWPAQTRQKDDRLCSDEKESIGRTRRLTGLKM